MSDHGSLVFRQRVCHWSACGTIFYLCRRCDRGQRYCSPHCRQKALRLQRRQANRRHQQSPEGREDHRDRQRDYRQRQRTRVTDKSSQPPGASASLTERVVIAALPASPALNFRRISGRPPQDGWVVCQICGRRGRWVDPFPHRRR
jgi:hypothetical protein